MLGGLGKLKRSLIRAKLKKEKFRIITELISVNKKLKILDELDNKEKENRKIEK